MPQPVSFVTFDLHAPAPEWREIAELFVVCFSAAPYFEEPAELQTIIEWGPAMLAGDGRLVTARMDGVFVGFALGHALSEDLSWQQTLSRLDDRSTTDALVIHELAVRESERGRGIARDCVRELLSGRVESRTLIGTYERAVVARSMYLRWGFEPIGRVPIRGDAIALHVLAARTADVGERLASQRSASPAGWDHDLDATEPADAAEPADGVEP